MKNARSIFDTVRSANHLGFWANQTLNAGLVTDFLDLRKSDVARIAQVAPASVRFDPKIPKAVLQRLEEIANICEIVAEFFHGDAGKTELWFKTPNPQLGNISPRDMIRFGRYRKLLQFVMAAVTENRKASSGSARIR